MRKSRKKCKKKYNNVFIVIILIIIVAFIVIFLINKHEKDKKIKLEEKNERIKLDIKKHYNTYVRAIKDTDLYNEKEEKVGKIGNNVELVLEEQDIDYDTEYFIIKNFDGKYYIKYQDVEKIDNLSEYTDRYKKYILFNENIVTKDNTSFYDKNGELVYEFNKSYNLPIIIKETERYGIEFEDRLLYVKSDDVKEIIENKNTDDSNAKGIPVLNYHFVYKNGTTTCNEEICHSESQMTQHFSYIKDNNFFTPTLEELEMYIDGQLRLSKKSVVITFDDGTMAENAREYVDKYQLNATLFLITSWFSKEQFESPYLEIASHGDDLHSPGICPGGQGGAIKCLEKNKLLEDLKTSREKLDNTTYFCYPFYEYNEYAISNLKEAGYTMAFVGESYYSDNLVKVGSNKFKLPRFVVVNYTTMSNFTNYINVD